MCLQSATKLFPYMPSLIHLGVSSPSIEANRGPPYLSQSSFS
jgi:hypothetical protein